MGSLRSSWALQQVQSLRLSASVLPASSDAPAAAPACLLAVFQALLSEGQSYLLLAAGAIPFGQHSPDSTVPLVPADVVSASALVTTAAIGSWKGRPCSCCSGSSASYGLQLMPSAGRKPRC